MKKCLQMVKRYGLVDLVVGGQQDQVSTSASVSADWGTIPAIHGNVSAAPASTTDVNLPYSTIGGVGDRTPQGVTQGRTIAELLEGSTYRHVAKAQDCGKTLGAKKTTSLKRKTPLKKKKKKDSTGF